MADINLHMNKAANVTCISNAFIDFYMKDANGEYVKIYLYLLRSLAQDSMDFSIAAMADALGHTQLDIRRALSYWEEQGLVSVRCDSMGEICDICLNEPASGSMSFTVPGAGREIPVESTICVIPGPSPTVVPVHTAPAGTVVPIQTTTAASVASIQQTTAAASVTSIQQTPAAASVAVAPVQAAPTAPAAPVSNIIPIESHTYSAGDLDSFSDNHEVREIIFIAERYLGRTLTATDVNNLLYWYDGLSMSVDLIEHLIAHCVDLGKTSMAYMNKVAIAWASDGIHTVDEASDRSEAHSTEAVTVMRALGISGRSLTPVELGYITRWFEEWSFTPEMVEEACNRTIVATGKPVFPYVESILSDWHNSGVSTPAQLPDADRNRRRKYEPASRKTGNASNRFHNYTEASYDIASIETQLLKRKY